MEQQKVTHFLHVPWTGLGNFQGFRGDRWYRNRIKVFKQFVIPSLVAQTNRNFILWCAFRFQEKSNPLTWEIKSALEDAGIKNVFTFSGIAFLDDKYSDDIARSRLLDALHGSMGELINSMGDSETVYFTIQPSDDVYYSRAIESIHSAFRDSNLQAVGFRAGYVCDYKTLEVKEWNPTTNPPFFTIKFDREVFIDPLKHFKYAAHKSHEDVPTKFRYGIMDGRGYLVGVHGENISTVFNHPFTGQVCYDVLESFGLKDVEPLKIPTSIRKKVFRRMPFKAQKKLRYWAGEKKWILRPIFAYLYDTIRS